MDYAMNNLLIEVENEGDGFQRHATYVKELQKNTAGAKEPQKGDEK